MTSDRAHDPLTVVPGGAKDDGARGCTRREFVAATLAAPAVASGLLDRAAAADGVRVASPDGAVELRVLTDDPSRLRWSVSLRGRPVVEPSPLGVVVDGVDLGAGVAVGRADAYRADERYPWRGVHAVAVNRYRGARIPLRHAASGTELTLDVRVFDDGVAVRHVVPGRGSRVPDEAIAFVLPAGATVWSHDLRGHYEGSYERRDVGEVPAGQWAAPPMTVKLPGGAGYAAITESAVIDYAGMALQATGDRAFAARLGHAHPASYPYTLRYGEENAACLAKPAPVDGTITTPWRVVMLGRDLDALVNCDLVHDLAPPPDARLFPRGMRTDWVRPGRAVWKYLDGGGENTLAVAKEFSRLAGELGFEYQVLEGFWSRFSEAELRELVEYSRRQGVGLWLWKHSRDLRDAEARRAFLDHARDVGAVGVKLDFFDHEAREVMDLYRVLLREAAERRLMVNFHGADKPAGEARTWPNELTREAVSGMERRSTPAWAPHDTTLPFTRLLAGHMDFTPTLFGERRRETSWAHQIANAAVLGGPLLTYGAHPRALLDNPAAEMIRAIPAVWDETRVLAPSAIGELAVLARRAGGRWFLAITNGAAPRTLDVPLAFLPRGRHDALLVGDVADDAAAVRVERARLRRGDAVRVDLRAGGGFIGRFG
jgi:alpha-glucosidase